MTIDCADALTLLSGRMLVSADRLFEIFLDLTGDLPINAYHPCLDHFRQQLPQLAMFLDQHPMTKCNWRELLQQATREFGNSFTVQPIRGWEPYSISWPKMILV